MVYVDELVNWGTFSTCHMIADSEEELHLFGKKIGLKRKWFQPLSFPHYDLWPSKRRLAVKRGAVELSNKAFVEKIRMLRDAGS